MGLGRPPSNPTDDPASLGLPVRRPQPCQSRDKVYPVRAFNLLSQGLNLRRLFDDPETVAQPLDGGSGNKG